MSSLTNRSSSTSSIKVKFNKTSCYFCNEWLENEQIEAHLVACGQVSERCSNGCGARVPRKEMDRHLNRCPAGFGEEPKTNGVGSPKASEKIHELEREIVEKIFELEQEIVALRGTLNEEIRQRLALITDIGQLKKRAQLADEWTGKVGEVLNALKKCINEETESRCVDIERCKIDINGLLKQSEQMESWRVKLITRLNQAEEEMEKVQAAAAAAAVAARQPSPPQSKPEDAGGTSKTRDAKLVMIESRLNHLQAELESLAVTMKSQATDQNRQQQQQQNSTDNEARAAIEEIESKLQTVDVVLEDHHNSIRSVMSASPTGRLFFSTFFGTSKVEFFHSLWKIKTKRSLFQSDISRQMFELRGESDPMRLVIQEMLDKQAKLDYELKGALNMAHETEDSSERIQKTLDKYRRETYYTKQCLDDLQVHLQHQEKLLVLQNTDGHLIWRIDQFERRFKESQENEVMLKSPLFSNKPFGYTLRLEASLNGIGTWRNRNLIVGLIVVSGFYDNLLEWPCVLSGTVTLRDQPVLQNESEGKPTKVQDFCKPILARRKHQHYEKNQYIHIPHQVLRSENYIRDDTIFLEVRIERRQQQQ
ncbi:TNF receptor-associated factor 5 [Sabethes cyaneus]|uniref:TNF receptor-associated factor 5 n=1 Tax=Sabethes cyaneus TaxID=53552 RepID=UPI00237E3852|nr:TNF receptor-associated factor 5 [Sabethes cyaneus]